MRIIYIGTVILKRKEDEVWKMTPRKFTALVDMHGEITDPERKPETSKKVHYINEIVY